jgi:hypothetical protein
MWLGITVISIMFSLMGVLALLIVISICCEIYWCIRGEPTSGNENENQNQNQNQSQNRAREITEILRQMLYHNSEQRLINSVMRSSEQRQTNNSTRSSEQRQTNGISNPVYFGMKSQDYPPPPSYDFVMNGKTSHI